MRDMKRWLAVALTGFLTLQSGVPVYAAEETGSTQETSQGISQEEQDSKGESAEESGTQAEDATESAPEALSETSTEEGTSDKISDENTSDEASSELSEEPGKGAGTTASEENAEEASNSESDTEVTNSDETKDIDTKSTDVKSEDTEADTKDVVIEKDDNANKEEDSLYYSLDDKEYTELTVTEDTASVDVGEVTLPYDIWLKLNDDTVQKSSVDSTNVNITIGKYTVNVTAKEKVEKTPEEDHVITYSINGGEYKTIDAFDADGNAVIEVGELPYTINFKVDGENAKDYAPDTELFDAEVDGHKITLKATKKAEKKESEISFMLNGEKTIVKNADYAEDGSYTIELPEGTEFPLQITFTVDGKDVVNEFAAADATFEIEGKIFKLHVAEKKTHTLSFYNGWYDQEIYLDGAGEDGTWTIRMAESDISYPYEVTFTYDGKKVTHTFTSADDIFEIGAYKIRLEVPVLFYNLEKSKEPVYASDFENGIYKIWLGQDPFFPYEVQFTVDGEKQDVWFDDPNDTVTVGGYTIQPSAYFTGDVITQMSFEVAGRKVIVRPEEKTFTESDGNMALFSIYYPLEKEITLDTVDLTGLTPVELTQVKLSNVFRGENKLASGTAVVYEKKDSSDDNYIVSSVDGTANLNASNDYSDSDVTTDWEMIVGTADQLDTANIRYYIPIKTTSARNWLTNTVKLQKADGTRKDAVLRYSRNDTHGTGFAITNANRQEYGYVDYNNNDVYAGFSINSEKYSSVPVIKAYKGKYDTAEKAKASTDVTAQFFATDLSAANTGYQLGYDGSNYVTLVSYDAQGNATGCMPYYVTYYFYSESFSLGVYYNMTDDNDADVTYDYDLTTEQVGNTYAKVRKFYTYREYPADGEYYTKMYYSNNGEDADSLTLTGAYVGLYANNADAVSKGAVNIKDSLFGNKGYKANYSNGIYITVIIGKDGDKNQIIRYYKVATVQGTKSNKSNKDSSTNIPFTGLSDRDGNAIKCWMVNHYEDDSYGEGNFITFIVKSVTDVSDIAPVFTDYHFPEGKHVYRAGSNKPIKSGEDFADFSNGKTVQYTCTAANGDDSQNYWVQVLTAVSGQSLYVTNLMDPQAKTTTKDGTVYSTRNVFVDTLHNGSYHDIFVANVGTESIPNLKVELTGSTTLQLDNFWTLTGNHQLEGFDNQAIEGYDNYERRAKNFAKVRLRPKDGVTAGIVDGTLTFSSNGKKLLVLTLTGAVGNPQIITKDIPQAVKYVPYGTIIQNNNRYSSNKVTYKVSGTLPAGMELKPNGEIYGVPQESGEYTFWVTMENSMSTFNSSWKQYTLTVFDNTDENVDNATDQDYYLIDRIASEIDDSQDRELRSNGVLSEYRAVYLDGQKLAEGTDYDAESGSTRITLKKQTIAKAGEGKHTIGVEFRQTKTSETVNKDDGDLKKAAQNFTVKKGSNNNTNSNNNGGSSNSSSSSSSNSSSNASSSSSSTEAVSPSSSSKSGRTTGAKPAETSNNGGSQAATDQNTIMVPYADFSIPSVLYKIARGDSLRKIAKKYYGSEDYWKKIFDDNRDVVKKANLIYPGRVLKLFAMDLGNGTYLVPNENGGSIVPATVPVPTGENSNQTNAGTQEASAADSEVNQPTVTKYVVAKGDTLSRIAKRVYGKSTDWSRIYDANRDQIPNPNLIYPGQQLNIPQ